MKGTLDIHRELLAGNVPHEVIRLPRMILDARELPEVLDLPAQRCVAVRVYQADDLLVAVGVACGQVPDPARLVNLLGARTLRPASADLINSVTDFAANLVSPLLLPAEVIVLLDAELTRSQVLYLPTGESGTALGIPSLDLVRVARATVAQLCLPAADTPLLDESGGGLAWADDPLAWPESTSVPHSASLPLG